MTITVYIISNLRAAMLLLRLWFWKRSMLLVCESIEPIHPYFPKHSFI